MNHPKKGGGGKKREKEREQERERERRRGQNRFLMLIYERLAVVSCNKWLVGAAAALAAVRDTKCIVRSTIRPNLHM